MAAVQGSYIPATAADTAGVGTITWTNTAGVTSARVNPTDGAQAAGTVGTTVTTHWLKTTNFGFTIPTGSTITGIKAQWGRFRGGTGTTVKDSSMKLVQAGTITGNDKADTATNYSIQNGTLPQYAAAVGSSTDLWGLTWAAADINDSTFGIAMSCTLTSTADTQATCSLQIVGLTVFFVAPGSNYIQFQSRIRPAPFRPGLAR